MIGRIQRRNRSQFFMVTVIAMLLLAATACSSADDSTPTVVAEGTLSGTVSIGPLCPVEPCNDPPNPFTGLEVVLATVERRVVATTPLRDDGTFSGTVPVGEYLLTLEPCDFLGCNVTLPIQVRVTKDAPTVIEINIDTGIR